MLPIRRRDGSAQVGLDQQDTGSASRCAERQSGADAGPSDSTLADYNEQVMSEQSFYRTEADR